MAIDNMNIVISIIIICRFKIPALLIRQMLASIILQEQIRRIFKDYKEDINVKEVKSPLHVYMIILSPIDCHLINRYAATIFYSVFIHPGII